MFRQLCVQKRSLSLSLSLSLVRPRVCACERASEREGEVELEYSQIALRNGALYNSNTFTFTLLTVLERRCRQHCSDGAI